MDARRPTALLLAAAMTAAGGALAGCASGPKDGAAVARDTAAQHAKRVSDGFGRRTEVRDAEYIAATEIPAGLLAGDTDPTDEDDVGATVLAWAGRTTGDERATIDIRFTVTVRERGPVAFGDRGHTAGSATVCYRYTLQLYRDTGYREFGCPAIATPPVPSASPPLRLPDDAADRLAAALRTATPDTLAGTVRAAFPQPGITVDTVTVQGTLVAAVGVPAERDCVVVIRTPDGATKRIGFDRVQLAPGEAGCSTGLFTNPPR